MNILISSIVRNRINFLSKWAEQLNNLSELNQDINFYLSVYENDSIDGSKDFLKQIRFPLFMLTQKTKQYLTVSIFQLKRFPS